MADGQGSKGLVIDGIVCSEHVDSSGEILLVEGADISSLQNGAELNWEHAGDDQGPSSIIGKFIKAKKIFGAKDCDDDRQKTYWEACKVPFVYGVVRLFDASGHENAKAAAAIIRDQAAAGEPLSIRWSVEGSTLERDGNVLKRTIARRCAATMKPANKSAVTGVLLDPEQGGAKTDVSFLEETAKGEGTLFRRLGEGLWVDQTTPAEMLVAALAGLRKMQGGMPGAQTGQAALETENLATSEQKNRAKAALRDYDKFQHGPFKTYLKSQLPDASDEFVDHFSDLVDDLSVKGRLKHLRKDEEQPKVKKPKAEKAPPVRDTILDPPGGVVHKVTVTVPKNAPDPEKAYRGVVRDIKDAQAAGEPAPSLPPAEKDDIHRRKMDRTRTYFDKRTGVVYFAKKQVKGKPRGPDGKVLMWTPSPLRIYIPEADDDHYMQILSNPGINEIHNRALDHWFALHKLTREGRLPHGVVALSALFSTMSPNCLDDKTEALTKRGWVPGFDLRMDDEILTKNAETNALEWQKPTDLRFFPDYEGPLVEFKSRSFNVITTPDHRWLVTTGRGVVREKTSATIGTANDQIHRTGEYQPASVSSLTGDEAELLGWFVTDGFIRHFKNKTKPDRQGCFLVQSPTANPEKCARIDALLSRLGPSGRDGEWTRYSFPKDGKYVWRIGTRLSNMLISRCPDRTLTVATLVDLDRHALERLKESMILGDGCINQHKEHSNWKARKTLTTGRREQADAFQALVTLTGGVAYSYWRDMSMYSPKSDKMKNIPKMTGCFNVSVQQRKFTRLESSHRREFVGKVPVWCPVVPNSFFVARRSGQVFITGNTAVPLQELAFARVIDMMHNHKWDPTVELPQDLKDQYFKEFKAASVGHMMPEFMKDFFSIRDSRRSTAWTKEGETKGEPYLRPVGLEGRNPPSDGKWDRTEDYHAFHQLLSGMVGQHGADGREISRHILELKSQNEKDRNSSRNKGLDPGMPVASGFAVKTLRYLLGMIGSGNVVVPDTHFLRHTFGLMNGDPQIEQVKSSMLNAEHEPLWQDIDKYYYDRHPAVQFTREKIRRRYGEDIGEQALFPGFWLHWLSIEPHELQRGWQNQAENAGTDHRVFFMAAKHMLDRYGVPYDRKLLKDESKASNDSDETDWSDGGSMPARCAHVMHELELQFGTTPAMFAYYAFMLPHILSHSLSKGERLAAQLRKATDPGNQPAPVNPPAAPKVIKYKGKNIELGAIRWAAGPKMGQETHLVKLGDPTSPLGINRRTFVMDSKGTLAILPEHITSSTHFDVIRHPRQVGSGLVVSASRHGIPHHAHSPGQIALIDGIDLDEDGEKNLIGQRMGLTEREGGDAKWLASTAGHVGWVKPAGPTMDYFGHASFDDYTPAHREAAFYELAHKVFGLGDHVPVTAAFLHPGHGEPYSSQLRVDGAEHRGNGHRDQVAEHFRSGLLDRLALMDMILGNNDRHSGNWMVTPGGIHLIDNGLSLGGGKGTPWIPDYWGFGGNRAVKNSRANPFDAWAFNAPHPSTINWISKLKSTDLANHMTRLGIPTPSKREAIRRLRDLQLIAKLPDQSRAQLFFSPFLAGNPATKGIVAMQQFPAT
jgi:hypothetical protein